ncbi:NADP-dependent oxidoreductase domain-containing protein [Aspergillus californicus]
MAPPKLIWSANCLKALAPPMIPMFLKDVLAILKRHGINHIDTAKPRASTEILLAMTRAPANFLVDSMCIVPDDMGSAQKFTTSIAERLDQSLKRLKTDTAWIFYLHNPDPEESPPLEDMLSIVNDLYLSFSFYKFGLSNFSPADVRKIIAICKHRKWVRPSVYKGHYSPLNPDINRTLLPILRENKISFYADTLTTTVFVAETVSVEVDVPPKEEVPDLDEDAAILQSENSFSESDFGEPEFCSETRALLKVWDDISVNSGISKDELSNRWVVHHSALKGEFGDKVLVGPETLGEVEGALDGIARGPLPEDVAQSITGIFEVIVKRGPDYA